MYKYMVRFYRLGNAFLHKRQVLFVYIDNFYYFCGDIHHRLKRIVPLPKKINFLAGGDAAYTGQRVLGGMAANEYMKLCNNHKSPL